MRILVGGKGGTGKTVVAGLIIRSIIEDGGGAPVLAVDADPDANLGETLGVQTGSTVGQVREDLLLKQGKMGPGLDKGIWLESKIHEILAERDGFDLLAMGRSEGPGCYCAVNNILRTLLESLSSAYRYVVIDAEAGLEHISRRTTGRVDRVVLVTDSSIKAFRTAGRIVELAGSLGSRMGAFHLIANRVTNGREALRGMAARVGLQVDLFVPEDPEVVKADMEGRSIFTLDRSSPALEAVRGFVAERILNGG